jgi:hypothetical protein
MENSDKVHYMKTKWKIRNSSECNGVYFALSVEFDHGDASTTISKSETEDKPQPCSGIWTNGECEKNDG